MLPIIRRTYHVPSGKTIIECSHNERTITVFADGDKSESKALLCNIVENEVGDTFTARRDSKTMDETGKKPLYLAGQIVTRQKPSFEFKSLSGDNAATQFAQGAKAFGLTLVVQMAG